MRNFGRVAPPRIDPMAIYRSSGPFRRLRLFVLAPMPFFPGIALVFLK